MFNKIIHNKLGIGLSNKSSAETNSSEYVASLEDYIEDLEARIRQLEEDKVFLLQQQVKPSKLSLEDKEELRNLRKQGVSIVDLANHYNCSTTTIHRIVKDLDVDNRRQKTKKQISFVF